MVLGIDSLSTENSHDWCTVANRLQLFPPNRDNDRAPRAVNCDRGPHLAFEHTAGAEDEEKSEFGADGLEEGHHFVDQLAARRIGMAFGLAHYVRANISEQREC